MLIAVTSQNFRTVTGHAGRARRFIVYEADHKNPPREIERLDLDASMAIHGYNRNAIHPLDRMKVLITGGAGQGFVRHLAARGVLVVATDQSDPSLAVQAFLSGRTKSASGGCNHDHSDLESDSHSADSQRQACDCHN